MSQPDLFSAKIQVPTDGGVIGVVHLGRMQKVIGKLANGIAISGKKPDFSRSRIESYRFRWKTFVLITQDGDTILIPVIIIQQGVRIGSGLWG
jgi:hypothetical protein